MAITPMAIMLMAITADGEKMMTAPIAMEAMKMTSMTATVDGSFQS